VGRWDTMWVLNSWMQIGGWYIGKGLWVVSSLVVMS